LTINNTDLGVCGMVFIFVQLRFFAKTVLVKFGNGRIATFYEVTLVLPSAV